MTRLVPLISRVQSPTQRHSSRPAVLPTLFGRQDSSTGRAPPATSNFSWATGFRQVRMMLSASQGALRCAGRRVPRGSDHGGATVAASRQSQTAGSGAAGIDQTYGLTPGIDQTFGRFTRDVYLLKRLEGNATSRGDLLLAAVASGRSNETTSTRSDGMTCAQRQSLRRAGLDAHHSGVAGRI